MSRLAFGVEFILSSPRKKSADDVTKCRSDAGDSSIVTSAQSVGGDASHQSASSKQQPEQKRGSGCNSITCRPLAASITSRRHQPDLSCRNRHSSSVDTSAPSRTEEDADRCGDNDNDGRSSVSEDDASDSDSCDSYSDSHGDDTAAVSPSYSGSDAIAKLRRDRDGVTSSSFHASTRFSVTDILDAKKTQQQQQQQRDDMQYCLVSRALVSPRCGDVTQGQRTALQQSPVKSPGAWPYGHVLPWLTAPPGLAVNASTYIRYMSLIICNILDN